MVETLSQSLTEFRFSSCRLVIQRVVEEYSKSIRRGVGLSSLLKLLPPRASSPQR